LSTEISLVENPQLSVKNCNFLSPEPTTTTTTTATQWHS